MRISLKKKSLGKKVLLSVIAAGVMSGFVLQQQAFAADQVYNEPVKMDKIELYSTNMELNAGGTVSGKKEEHADVAARVGENSTLKATGVAFTGEISVQDGGQVVLNGGSVTSGNQYMDEGVLVANTFTEIGVTDGGSLVTANNVKLDTNLGAFDGGQIVINDSNINAIHGIYVAGINTHDVVEPAVAMITLNGSGNNTYTVGEFFEANDGGILKIHGGGTIDANGNRIRALNGADLEIDSGNNTTNIDGSIFVINSSLYVNGKLNVFSDTLENSFEIRGGTEAVFDSKADITCGEVDVVMADGDGAAPTLTIEKGAKLTTSYLHVGGEGAKIVSNGTINTAYINAYYGGEMTLNGGLVDCRLDENTYNATAAYVDNAKITANNVNFVGNVFATNFTDPNAVNSGIIINGGSITAVPFEDEESDAEHTLIRASSGASITVDKGAVIKSNIGAVKGGRVVINNSTLEDAEGHNDDGAIYAENVGSVVEINNTPSSNEGLYAWDGGQVNITNSNLDIIEAIAGDNDIPLDKANAAPLSIISINGSENSTYNFTTMEAFGNARFTVEGGKVNAGYVGVVGNATMNLTTGGTVDSNKLNGYGHVRDYAVEVIGGTLNATDVEIIGAVDASEAGKISLTGGKVTAIKGNDGYSEFGASDSGSVVTTDGTDIQAEVFAYDGGVVTLNNSNIDTASINQGIWARGNGAVINLNGSENNTYTVGDVLLAAEGGKIYITGGTLKDNALKSKMYGIKDDEGGVLNTAAKGIVLKGTGVIETMSDQIYENAASETQKNSGAIINEGIDFVGGTLSLNDAKYTLGYSQTALAELQKQGATKLVMTGTLVEESGEVEESKDITEIVGSDDGKLEYDKVTANTEGNLLVGAGATGGVEDVNIQQSVNNGFSVASIDLKAGSTGIVITNDKDVTLGGSAGGSVVTVDGNDANVKIVVGTTSTVAGATDTKGSLNIGNSRATETTQYNLNGEVVINNQSSLNTKGQVNVTGNVTVNNGSVNAENGSLTTSKLEVKESGNVLGNVNANELKHDANTQTNIGNSGAAGKLTVEKATLNGGMVFLDPAWQDGATISDASGLAVRNMTALDGAYVVGQNSVLSLGADLATAQSAFNQSGQVWSEQGITAAAYLANQVDVSGGSIVVKGSLTTAPTASPNGTVEFASQSMLMVDSAKVANGNYVIKSASNVSIDAGSKLYIADAANGGTYKIFEDGTVLGSYWTADNIISNKKLMEFTVNAADNTISAVSRSVAAVYGDAVISGNTFDQAIIDGGAAADFVAEAANEHVNATTASQVSALNSAAAMSELAGVEHGTFAASNLFTDAVAEHMSLVGEKDHAKDVWAKYIHSKDKVDGLAIAGNNAKYDATYNGIVVGSDLYKQGKGIVGAALTYVDGSIKGNTLAARTENDATYYGLSIYGGIQNEDSVVVGDISYLHGKNDITQRNSGMNLTADAKSDAFSIGVRAEKAFQAGKCKLAPYAGLRYMHLGTGNYTNSIGVKYDGDDMNLWLLPVGVKYSADIENGDWTIRPIAEISYVWNMGDRNANQTVSLNGASDGFGFDVADSGSYVGRFVVEAQKANVTYGLGYEYQKGDSVKTSKWMANVNWTF